MNDLVGKLVIYNSSITHPRCKEGQIGIILRVVDIDLKSRRCILSYMGNSFIYFYEPRFSGEVEFLK